MNIFKLNVPVEEELERQTDSEFNKYTNLRGFVVIAPDEASARAMCAAVEYGGPWWLDRALTTCEVVEASGDPRIVLANEPTG